MAGGGVAALGVHTERAAQYKGRMTLAVAMTCLVAAVGGAIFGYDIGISGTHASLLPPPPRSPQFSAMHGRIAAGPRLRAIILAASLAGIGFVGRARAAPATSPATSGPRRRSGGRCPSLSLRQQFGTDHAVHASAPVAAQPFWISRRLERTRPDDLGLGRRTGTLGGRNEAAGKATRGRSKALQSELAAGGVVPASPPVSFRCAPISCWSLSQCRDIHIIPYQSIQYTRSVLPACPII